VSRTGASVLLVLAAGLAGCRPPEQAAGGAARISSSGSGAFEVALTRFGDGAAVAWYDTRDGNAEIYLRMVDRSVRPIGPEYRLTTDEEQSYEASIAAAGDSLAVAWYDKDAKQVLNAWLGVWDAGAGWLWKEQLGTGSRNPVVRAAGNRLFAAWIEPNRDDPATESVKYGFWSLDGAMHGVPQAAGPAGSETWNLNAAPGPGDDTALIAFDAPDAAGVYELFVAEAGPARARLLQVSSSDGHASKYPDVAVYGQSGNERIAVTWFDEKDGNAETYLASAPFAALEAGFVDRNARRISFTDTESIGSYLAWNDGLIGVAWSDRHISTYDVRFQAFDGEGTPVGTIREITNTTADSLIPAIVAWGNGFAIAWNERQASGVSGHASAGSEIYLDRADPR